MFFPKGKDAFYPTVMEERVMKKFALGLLAASLLLAAAQPVAAAEYELHLNMPLPPTNTRWELFLDGVMTDLEERSGGRIKVVPYFAESMSKISECFETVKTGLADLTEVALLNAPGQFPFHERAWDALDPARVSENPTTIMHQLQKEFPEVMKDFEGAKFLNSYDGVIGQFIAMSRPVTSLADLKGKKIVAFGGPTVAAKIEALGAVPVSMSPGDAYMALQQGIAEGAMTGFGMLVNRRFGDMLKHLVPVNITGVILGVAMNQDTYDSLPDDLRQVVDQTFGEEFTQRGTAYMSSIEYQLARQWRDEMGGVIHPLTDAEYEEIHTRFAALDKAWADKLTAAGLPGDNILARLRELENRHSPLWKDSRLFREFGIH